MTQAADGAEAAEERAQPDEQEEVEASNPGEGAAGKAEPERTAERDEDAARAAAEAERQAHVEEFTRRTGMSPDRCYRLVLASLTLRLLGGGWVYMVMLEYTRFYVVNDLNLYNVLQTVTGSPQMIVQAFLFPVWGVVSDRVSRKKVLVAATLAFCLSNWLLTFVPCVEVFIFTKVLNLIVDIGNPIRDAMLRDIFSKGDWESNNGGATGIKSRMGLLLAVASGLSVVTGLGILQLGNMGVLLPNEYTLHKEECKDQRFCVPPGHFSWEGHGWHIDGCLRLLMVMGTAVLSVEAILVIFCFPETIRPEHRRTESIWQFFRQSCRELGWPWDNLRVFATPQLRTLMGIRFISYVVAAGGTSMFISFYRRFDDLDTFKMTVLAISAGTAGWFTMLAVPALVRRYGDIVGIWIPGNVLCVAYGVCLAFIGPGSEFLVFLAWPIFAGPSSVLTGLQPELIAKLIPPDVQGTFQTGKSFIYRMTQGVFMWPWTLLANSSADYAYPFDGLPIWGSCALGVLMLVLMFRNRRNDPREALASGRALDEFYQSAYAKGPWYKHQGGSNVGLNGCEEDPEEDVYRATRCELPTVLPTVLTRGSTVESLKLAKGASGSSLGRRKGASSASIGASIGVSTGSVGSGRAEHQEKITITVTGETSL